MPPRKSLKKAPAPSTLDWLPSKTKANTCNHQNKMPCFLVRMPDKVYHWPDEAGAVMFALRHSREQGCKATVYDPLGNVITEFTKRKYPTSKVPKDSLHLKHEYPDTPPKKAAPAKKTLKKRKP